MKRNSNEDHYFKRWYELWNMFSATAPLKKLMGVRNLTSPGRELPLGVRPG